MTPGEWVYVALGSNLGDRAAHLAAAREALTALPETEVAAVSTIEETAPLGPPQQPAYLNQMVLLRTALAPDRLLAELLRIEDTRARQRDVRWGPRTLDLDIVRFGSLRRTSPTLQLPHPELAHRPFWQRELAELEPHVR